MSEDRFARQKIQGQLQLVLTLVKINSKEGLLRIVKNSAPPLKLKKEEEICDGISGGGESKADARSGYVKKGHKKKLPSHSNNSEVKKLARDINQEDERSLGLLGGSDLDGNTVIYPTNNEDQVS